ncbi:uncharacterized protein LOC123562705 [Mercenaria mercenaria]|uniref:uncharacterized protein LOC123562705 n=1 Tax=Mercenaria mercenaria TaxID=6596 RepID=UPI00234F0396|nr:uncharacterized protein LOC123562705 [Mercenaria mercenaria]
MAEGGLNEKENLCDFSKQTTHNDVQFIVENQEVYASRAVLCIASPVFDELFENNPTQTVELPGVEIEHFKQFLKCIYPHILDEINEETVYWILPFAHKYKVKILRERCVKMILEIIKRRYVQNAKELYRHIKLSELYEVQEFEELCVDMASECTLTEIEEANKDYPISPETDLRIMKIGHRKLELAKQDMELCGRYIKKDNLQSAVTGLLDPKLYLESTDPEWETYRRYKYFKEEEKYKNYMQASRLVHVHFKGNQGLKADAIRNLEEVRGEDIELFKLLPHDLKIELEKYRHSQ